MCLTFENECFIHHINLFLLYVHYHTRSHKCRVTAPLVYSIRSDKSTINELINKVYYDDKMRVYCKVIKQEFRVASLNSNETNITRSCSGPLRVFK